MIIRIDNTLVYRLLMCTSMVIAIMMLILTYESLSAVPIDPINEEDMTYHIYRNYLFNLFLLFFMLACFNKLASSLQKLKNEIGAKNENQD